MVCERLEMPGGGWAIVCSRGARRPTKGCSVCGRAGDFLCDEPVGRRGKTCDARLCEICASLVGPDRHRCPAHAVKPLELAAPPAPAPSSRTKPRTPRRGAKPTAEGCEHCGAPWCRWLGGPGGERRTYGET